MSIPQGIKRVICLFLAACFSLQNTLTCYGQALVPVLTPPALNFNPPTLKYLSVNSANPNNYFNFLLDKGQSPQGTVPVTNASLEQEAKKLIHYFFIGLTLPESSLWVNLRPDQPGRITSLELAQTDMGKLLLEQDLRLKKDVAQYLNPKHPTGKMFWEELYTQAELLLGKGKLKKTAITTSNRVWIVPDEAVVMETEDGALVTQAKLKVLLESEYLSLKSKSWNKEVEVQSQNKDQLKNLTEALMKSIVIPEITREVNSGKNYAPLRQIYHSLILAQWFKQKHRKQKEDGKGIPYIEAIDQSWLKGLESEFPWSKDAIWQEYLTSFQKGEYQLKEKLAGLNRMYTSGGMALGSISGILKTEPFSGGVSSPLMQDSDRSIPIITRKKDSADAGRYWPSQITPVSAASPLTEQRPSAASPLEQEDKADPEKDEKSRQALKKLIGLLNIERDRALDIAAIKQMLQDGSLFEAISQLKDLDVESAKDPGHTTEKRIDHVIAALEVFEGLPGNILKAGGGEGIKNILVGIRERIGQDPNDLYLLRLAILLHDIGKRPEKKPLDASHEERGAADVLPLILGRIKGLTEEDKETVSYLVAYHSVLDFFGKNRDNSDYVKDNLVVEAANVLGDDLKRIEMLYLLSIADFVALDAEEKKNSSIGLLFLAKPFEFISAALSEEGGLAKARKKVEEEYLRVILSGHGEEIKKLYLGLLGLPFIAGAGHKQMQNHLSLLEAVSRGETTVTLSKLTYYDWTPYRELVVGVPKDKPGLLRVIAGILVKKGYDIHLAQIITAKEGIVFDRFLIKGTSNPDDEGLSQELVTKIGEGVLTEEDMADIKQKLPELPSSNPKIDFEDSADNNVTQMTIETGDVMGLLFRITDILNSLEINLRNASIETWGSKVRNVFFIERNGQPLSKELKKELKGKMERELTAPAPSSSSPKHSSLPVEEQGKSASSSVANIDAGVEEKLEKARQYFDKLNNDFGAKEARFSGVRDLGSSKVKARATVLSNSEIWFNLKWIGIMPLEEIERTMAHEIQHTRTFFLEDNADKVHIKLGVLVKDAEFQELQRRIGVQYDKVGSGVFAHEKGHYQTYVEILPLLRGYEIYLRQKEEEADIITQPYEFIEAFREDDLKFLDEEFLRRATEDYAPPKSPEPLVITKKRSGSLDTGGIDLSQIEVTLKDEQFVSQLNPADLKILRAAKYLKEGWGSLSLLYVHEIMLLLKGNLASDVKQKGLLQEVLKQLQVRGFIVPEIKLALAG